MLYPIELRVLSSITGKPYEAHPQPGREPDWKGRILYTTNSKERVHPARLELATF
jgi:hypothetical protein